VIQCDKLCRDFKIYSKDPHLKGTLKSFFNRKFFIKSAVKNFDLNIESPGLVGLLGPNGSGKTTLMKMMTGIIVPSEGFLRVLGEKPSDRKNSFKKKISLVMGNKSQLWWDIPVMDSFLLFQKYYEIEEKSFKKRVGELGERLDSSKLFQTPVRKLSLGERMKMELMACLLHEPQIIFLDEPTIGLDVISQKKVRQFLKDYSEEKKPLIILTSHYMADVEALCEKIVLILEGEKKFEGSIEEFKALFKREKTIVFSFESSVKKALKKCLKDFDYEWTQDYNQLKVRVPEDRLKELVLRVFQSFPVSDFYTEKAGVEEVMDEILSNC